MAQEKIAWFSTGVSSFISIWLENKNIDRILYCHIDDQHEDSMRFLRDCEQALGREIKILQSPYKCVDAVSKTFGYINGVYGAKCTEILKKRVRKEWEHGKENLVYIWGMDCDEKVRAERLPISMPKQKHIFPLIERGLSKQDTHAILKKIGIQRPYMYKLGYNNNNCVGCVKGGIGYWNKIRRDFPEVFESRAKLERIVGASCINGVYLDELEPNRGRMNEEIIEDCGISCMLTLEEEES